ncbi:hypothetical protein ACQP3C_28610, partial [Escherichia coli]
MFVFFFPLKILHTHDAQIYIQAKHPYVNKKIKIKKKKKRSLGWREGSEVKSTCCSSRGLEFNFQQP